ncbi:MAG: hypothetical protein A2504_14760 [Bdellovibrionales bacterium RIFOXYD12_FULL_39_22]|nr:MAG: hypothetical protein A2385_10225 [Bdellovibrionales bacterium RIFOXYB1_FULL_39_21]OFZ40838.1 MAG: hypothetical protein A2485_17385 [Bdellovibrionales bacterium RIFOXYC12_FULL_39_17]OFZ44379.1 MAG: hypothetical protein A2404_10995 [Bdellovibrionales bacterium RIFOXYC1_FULL_39_130]OFZ74126.1 MAG: hypothetical protein A2560_03660 [Bdellovibrionales bacterium RIFOXYD1_FULL_39_84]OFZ91975.1 MAG: hypothetical protein A2504_14760 [Bdellovibrionales bacterium RIFOXYD12_FULL_39_22]HLE12292.1 DU
MKFSFIIASVIFLCSCSHYDLGREECQSISWETRGLEDGESGLVLENFEKYRISCQQHQVTPNKVLYENGYNAGIKLYCSDTNIEELARKGGFNPICKKIDNLFLEKFSNRRIKILEEQISALTGEVSNLRGQLSSAEARANACTCP